MPTAGADIIFAVLAGEDRDIELPLTPGWNSGDSNHGPSGGLTLNADRAD